MIPFHIHCSVEKIYLFLALGPCVVFTPFWCSVLCWMHIKFLSITSAVFFQVAARVTEENAEKDEWFVVKVMHFDRETRE